MTIAEFFSRAIPCLGAGRESPQTPSMPRSARAVFGSTSPDSIHSTFPTPTPLKSKMDTRTPHGAINVDNRYKIIKKHAAEGASGVVDVALDLHTGNKVVIKRVKRTPHNRDALIKEELIHTRVSVHPHDNVAQLYDTLHDTPGEAAFVMEYCEGGDLLDTIPPDVGLPIDQALSYAQQLFQGIHHLHAKGYAHRDIKGENCVLSADKQTLKVIDFGYAVRLRDSVTGTRASGTVPYIAPEVFTSTGNDLSKCDVWAAGIVLYSMLTGRFPWSKAARTDFEFALFVDGTHSESEWPRWAALPDDVIVLVYDLLALNPASRPTAAQAAARLGAMLQTRLAMQGA